MTRSCALLLLLFSLTPATAQDVGRLFFTPEQRAALDARRKSRVPDKPTAAPVVISPTTRVDGFVRRSGGPSTVWVNGESLPESRVAGEGPRIERGRDTVSIGVGERNARARLKPGEVLDRGTGEVRDVLGSSGEIRVKPAP